MYFWGGATIRPQGIDSCRFVPQKAVTNWSTKPKVYVLCQDQMLI